MKEIFTRNTGIKSNIISEKKRKKNERTTEEHLLEHTRIAEWVSECYQSLTAHQHQKGQTVPKQVIMIATSIQVATV